MQEFICPKCGAKSHRPAKCRKDNVEMEKRCPQCGQKECYCN